MPVTRSRASTPFSLRLDPDLRARLDEEAERSDRSASWLAVKAIEAFVDARARKRRAIEQAIEEADRGVFVSSQAMGRWIDSWGSETELPPPGPDLRAPDRDA